MSHRKTDLGIPRPLKICQSSASQNVWIGRATPGHCNNLFLFTSWWVIALNDAYSVPQQPVFRWVEFDGRFVGRSRNQKKFETAISQMT
jgi:hypothetical protein